MSSHYRAEKMFADQERSLSVYVGLCHKIGTPQQVAYRRDMVDIVGHLANRVTLREQSKTMHNGSQRDGFRLSGSDFDVMHWADNIRVIWNFSQSEFYNIHRMGLHLCDSSESPPGYTLLTLPRQIASDSVFKATVLKSDGVHCISSSKFREVVRSFSFPNSTSHGPCRSGIVNGTLQYDEAYAFFSDFWPPSASLWKDRCHSWPLPKVVNKILRNGCHFVAIGHKLGKHSDDEWRISFSQAELKLVYSMNHTQFLTYGLLKLLLKETINKGLKDEDQLLSSYHIKTVVFWAIQKNKQHDWCPQHFLAGFWICFKLLLEWVYDGTCPNFYIPQNNLFLTNIHSAAQTILFKQLYRMYEEGIECLLQRHPFRTYLTGNLLNPRLRVCSDEHYLIPEAEFDVKLFHEIHRNDAIHLSGLHHCYDALNTVAQLIQSSLTKYQMIVLQKCTSSIFQSTAFMLQNLYSNTDSNKQVYYADKICCSMLKLATKFGFVSDALFIAMYYYKTSRFSKALSVIKKTKVKLAQRYVIKDLNVDKESYTKAVGGQPSSKKMKKTVALHIRLECGICYINEIVPEQQSSKLSSSSLYVSPFTLLHMLEFLSSRHVDTMRAQTALDELQVLVHHDQGQLVFYSDISWEILGICQQIAGNLQAALYSYQQSLRQDPHNGIRTATRQRIQDMRSYLLTTKRHVLGDPGDLSANHREPPGCPVLIPTVTHTRKIPAKMANKFNSN